MDIKVIDGMPVKQDVTDIKMKINLFIMGDIVQ